MGILDWLGLGGQDQGVNTSAAFPQGPLTPLSQVPQDFAVSGPMQMQPDASGFYDITGDTAAGVRGDEVTDTIDLLGYILQGATPQMIHMEARRRKYGLRDFKAVMSVARNVQQVASGVGLNTGGVLPNPQFSLVLQLLGRVLGAGRRRRRRGMSLKKGLEALVYMGKVAHAIKSAGRGIAAISRPRLEVVAPSRSRGVFGRAALQRVGRG